MQKSSPDSLSRAFSGAAGKLYAFDRAAAVRNAGRFFLDALRQMQGDQG